MVLRNVLSPPPSCRWRCSACRTYRAARSRPITADHSGPPNTFTTSPAIKEPCAGKMHGQQLLAERHPAGGQTHHGHQQGEGYAVHGVTRHQVRPQPKTQQR